MQYENFNQQNVQEKNDKTLFDGKPLHATAHANKTCKHRNENGWCSKSNRKCPLLDLVFITQ
jgi:hypothetical protein